MSVEFEGLSFDRPGHATVRIETASGTVLYVDPWNEVLDGAPGDADVVFSTHDDRDHYDPSAIGAVSTDDTTVVAFRGIDTSDLDPEVLPLGPGEELTVNGVRVRAVPAYNRPDGPHVRPNGEPYHPEGTAVGLVLDLDGTTVYFASDTDALEELFDVEADVAILPIGGRATMDRHGAAILVERIDPGLVLPVHYNSDVIDGLDADAEAFAADVEARGTQVVLF